MYTYIYVHIEMYVRLLIVVGALKSLCKQHWLHSFLFWICQCLPVCVCMCFLPFSLSFIVFAMLHTYVCALYNNAAKQKIKNPTIKECKNKNLLFNFCCLYEWIIKLQCCQYKIIKIMRISRKFIIIYCYKIKQQQK